MPGYQRLSNGHDQGVLDSLAPRPRGFGKPKGYAAMGSKHGAALISAAQRDNTCTIRVVLLSNRILGLDPWRRRSMALTHLAPRALDQILLDPPDALILDGTFDDARRVADCWELHDLVGIPLIVLAEGAAGEAVSMFFRSGADDVVVEPPDGDLLAARVAAIVRRQRSRPVTRRPNLLQFGAIQVDLARRLVIRANESQTLSRTEFGLLQALLEAGGRACSPAELVTRIWGAECASSTHYLRLYIRYLRQKLEKEPAHPVHIVNVRGVGYRLELNPVMANLQRRHRQADVQTDNLEAIAI
jgi:two-component system KDP operon response regulator KdpE